MITRKTSRKKLLPNTPAGYVDRPSKWIYHPDGSSKVIDTPAEKKRAGDDTSTEAAEHAKKSKTGEANTSKAGLTPDELKEVETLERKVQAEEDHSEQEEVRSD